MENLNQRQLKTLQIIEEEDGISSGQILSILKEVSKVTIIRDLEVLVNTNKIEKRGKGRGVKYYPQQKNSLLKTIDVDKYFEIDVDKREGVKKEFNFDIFKSLKNILSEEEKKEIHELNNNYTKAIKKIDKSLLKKELQRLTIELSWKSSQIEGNTYSLIDTEILIKQGQKDEEKSDEETQMILNHKQAIDFIFQNPEYFKKLTVKKIKELHKLLVKNMDIKTGFRANPIGITGTTYKPLDNKHQIEEVVEKMVKIINQTTNVFEKSLILNLMIAYIQPFIDGNKRTSRILGNAILFSFGFCPLSFRSIDEKEYKKAIVLFYEQNNAKYFKQLFIEQYTFAVENYFKLN